jgi:hypothetical protein
LGIFFLRGSRYIKTKPPTIIAKPANKKRPRRAVTHPDNEPPRSPVAAQPGPDEEHHAEANQNHEQTEDDTQNQQSDSHSRLRSVWRSDSESTLHRTACAVYVVRFKEEDESPFVGLLRVEAA